MNKNKRIAQRNAANDLKATRRSTRIRDKNKATEKNDNDQQ